MITVRVTGIDAIQKRIAGLSADMQTKVLRPAINKVAEKANAELARAIPEEYAVKASEVRSAVEIRRAMGGSLQAVLTVFGSRSKRGRSMNMIRFMAVIQAAGQAMKARGARVRKRDMKALGRELGFVVRRDGGLKRIPGAFIGNKGRTIFQRIGRDRLPIKAVQVIGFAQMFKSRKINRRIMGKIDADLVAEVDRAIKWQLSKA